MSAKSGKRRRNSANSAERRSNRRGRGRMPGPWAKEKERAGASPRRTFVRILPAAAAAATTADQTVKGRTIEVLYSIAQRLSHTHIHTPDLLAIGPSATPPPDQEDWSIPLNTGGADTQSTVSSARPAWDSVAESDDDDDDDDDEVASVASSRMTNTSSVASRSSRATPPASVSSSRRNKGPTPRGNAGLKQVPPRPATRQAALDARSAVSQTSSVGGRSEWPSSLAGNSQPPTVSAASATGSDTGQRSGTGPATRQSSRSSVSSSVRTGAGPSTPSTPSVADGFPTFADTEWGDPIAVAQKKSKGVRKRANRAKNAQAQAQAQALAARGNVLEERLELPPGGPGSSWGNPNEAW